MLGRKAFLVTQYISIPHIEPCFNRAEALAAHNYVLSGGWLTEHKKTRQLEEKIAEFLGVKHCFMVPNGTMALYVACYVLNVENVIVPDFTMIASPNAAEMASAHVGLVDVDRKTLCIAPSSAEEWCDTIMAVDLNGRAPPYDKIIPKMKGRYIIEDAAQAFGSYYQGQSLGTFGDIGCFSFSPHKIVSMGQGGCVVTNDDAIAAEIKRFKNFGRSLAGGYGHEAFGVNLKFTDLQAVVGLEQMKNLPERIMRKKAIFDRYRSRLYGYVEFLPTDLAQVTPWYVDILTPYRDMLAQELKKVGIGTQAFYPALHNTFWGGAVLPVSEEVSKKGLWLPSSVTLMNGQIDLVCEQIIRILEGMAI
ncbi:MAG: DegT/DnrJ/EryC1/StrS family aminotransferase [Candidatus Thorarchaeota archaeon]|jgi:perosamine synthetase